MVNNIIVIQIGKIGDMVLTIPLFYYLKQICPQARLTVLASAINDEIPKNLSYVNETITFSKNIVKGYLLLKSLRKRSYDILIDLNYNYSVTSQHILRTIKPKHSFGVNFSKKLYDIDLNSISKSPHLADVALAPVGFLKPDIYFEADAALKNEFKFKASDIPEFRMNNKKKILFNISAGSQSRYWGKENWIVLINDVMAKYGNEKFSYYITGIEENKDDIDYIINSTNVESLTNIKIYSLTHLFQVISSINFLISPDTSLIHIASAYNIPVLGLYPNVNWNLEKFKPLSEFSAVVVSNSHENIFDINEKTVFEKYCRLMDKI